MSEPKSPLNVLKCTRQLRYACDNARVETGKENESSTYYENLHSYHIAHLSNMNLDMVSQQPADLSLKRVDLIGRVFLATANV